MQKLVFALIAFIALLAAASASVNIPYTDCGGSNAIYKIKSLTGDYWPPVKGQSFTMLSNFDATKEVTGGTYKIQTFLSGISVDTQTGDFCTFGDVKCPLSTGNIYINNTGIFPASAPSGSYKVKTLIQDRSYNTVFCYSVEFKI